MTLLNENFIKELQRMSELAGISTSPVNESVSPIINAENKILKEDEEDLLGDIEDLLDDEAKSLGSQTKSVGKITKDLKTAMVLNNISQYEAANLDLSGEYNPETAGAKPEAEGGVEGTIYTKKPEEKLTGGSDEFERLKSSFTPEMINKLRKQGLSQEEINAVIHDKNQRSPVTFGKEGGNVQTAKWQPRIKDASIIKTQSIEKNGKMTIGISGVGKEQLEFLQRMLSDRPLKWSETEDEDIDIEETLLSDWPYKDLVIANAEHIIRDFFNKAIVGIIRNTLKRNVNAPKDSQFTMFIENGVDHALAQTKKRMYNQDFNNFGAWFIQVVKNKVIDQLKSITDYVFDTVSANQRFFAQTNPLVIDSKLDPERAIPGEYKVTKSPATFNVETGDGGFEKKNFFRYTFNDPREAASLFTSKAEDGKLSPFRSKFLRFPNEFYKSVPKEKPESLTKTTYEPGEGGFEEQARYEGIPAAELQKVAKVEVDNILNKIIDTILTSGTEAGEEVKIYRSEELKSQNPAVNKNPIKYTELNLTPSGIYEVIKKEPFKDTFLYTIKDNDGRELKLSNRYAKPLASLKDTRYQGNLRKDRNAPLEIMRLLLGYGQMVAVYNKPVFFKNENGTSRRVEAYSRFKHTGGKAETEQNGQLKLPYVDKNLTVQYKRLKDIPISFVWDSSKYKAEVALQIINKLSKVAAQKNIELPSTLFNNENKIPLFKSETDPAVKQELYKNTVRYISGVRNTLRSFFGFEGLGKPVIQKDRDMLDGLLKNYANSEQLAESHIRKVIRELMTEKLNKK